MVTQFKRGEFLEYRATTKIHIGQHKVDIMEDDIIEYDGITLRMGPDEFNTTLLRGAVKRGWLVPGEDTDSVYVPQSAGVTIGPVNTGNPMDYKNKKRLQASQRQMDVDAMSNEGEVVAGRGFTDFSDPANKNLREGTPGAGRRTMPVEVVDQEGEVVASVSKTPSRDDRTLVTNSAMAQNQISKTLSTPRRAQTVSGTPQPEIDTSGLSPEEAAVLKKLMAKAGGAKTASKQAPAAQSTRDPDYVPPEDAPWIKSEDEVEAAKDEAAAARAARLSEMGVDPGDPESVKNAAAPVIEPGEDAKIAEDGTVLLEGDDDLPADEPDAEIDLDIILDGEEPPASEEVEKRVLAEKMKMLQAMFPGFEWDMSIQWRSRVKKACEEHYGKPTLAAIKQIETDAVVKYIEQYEKRKAEES
jgi:hypothetical protein